MLYAPCHNDVDIACAFVPITLQPFLAQSSYYQLLVDGYWKMENPVDKSTTRKHSKRRGAIPACGGRRKSKSGKEELQGVSDLTESGDDSAPLIASEQAESEESVPESLKIGGKKGRKASKRGKSAPSPTVVQVEESDPVPPDDQPSGTRKEKKEGGEVNAPRFAGETQPMNGMCLHYL